MGEGKNCILLVDDEDLILELLQNYFESLGYEVLSATSAEEAIKLLNNGNTIDLILTDINLPGMSGLELLKIAKETKQDVSVILLTGFKTLDFAISAIKYGAQDYITKPFDLNNVRKVVERALKYRKKHQRQDQLYQYTEFAKLRFKIPTRELDPGVLADYVSKFIQKTGFFSEHEYHQFYLALTETLINAMEHGNLELRSILKGEDFDQYAQYETLKEERLNDPVYGNRTVELSMELTPEMVSITVTDEGPGFDWKKYVNEKHQIKGLNLESHGRGFIFINNIIDEVYFNDRGNSITLIKYKQTPQSL